MEKGYMKVTGIDGYNVTHSHNDVNGKWGEYKTWMVHYEGEGVKPRCEVYRHIGEYWSIGNYPDDYGPSKFEVVNTAARFINGEMGLYKTLLVCIEYYLRISGGTLGRLILEFGEFRQRLTRLLHQYIGNDA